MLNSQRFFFVPLALVALLGLGFFGLLSQPGDVKAQGIVCVAKTITVDFNQPLPRPVTKAQCEVNGNTVSTLSGCTQACTGSGDGTAVCSCPAGCNKTGLIVGGQTCGGIGSSTVSCDGANCASTHYCGVISGRPACVGKSANNVACSSNIECTSGVCQTGKCVGTVAPVTCYNPTTCESQTTLGQCPSGWSTIFPGGTCNSSQNITCYRMYDTESIDCGEGRNFQAASCPQGYSTSKPSSCNTVASASVRCYRTLSSSNTTVDCNGAMQVGACQSGYTPNRPPSCNAQISIGGTNCLSTQNGQTLCDGNDLLRCAAGSWDEIGTCPATTTGETCQSNGATRCVTSRLQTCNAGEWTTSNTFCSTTVTSTSTCTVLGGRPVDNGNKGCCSGLVQTAGSGGVCVAPNPTPAPGRIVESCSSGQGGTSRCVYGKQQLCDGDNWLSTNNACGNNTACTTMGGRTVDNNNRACCTGLIEMAGICSSYNTPADACILGRQRCNEGTLQHCSGVAWQNVGTCSAQCGNQTCETGEDISSCPQDCGASSTPIGGTPNGPIQTPPPSTQNCTGNNCTAPPNGCIAIHGCQQLDGNGHCTVLSPTVTTSAVDAQATANQLCQCVQVDVLNGQNGSCTNGHINGDISTLLDHRQVCPNTGCVPVTTPPPVVPPGATPRPSTPPTDNPSYSCNSTCTTNAQCQGVNQSLTCALTADGTKRCRNTANPTNTQCQLAVGPQCLSIAMAKADGTPYQVGDEDPALGDSIKFTCGTVTGAARYVFQVIEPGGTVTALTAVSNGSLSENYSIAKAGNFRAQCQICTESAQADPDNSSCIPFESLNS